MLFGIKVIITSGFLAAVLEFDLIQMSYTRGNGWVVFLVVGNLKIGVAVAFL